MKILETKAEENYSTITGLISNTEYTFQIRGVFGDQEGPYGPINDKIKTKKSLGSTMLDFCVLLDDSKKPLKYNLPAVENKSARNENARSRQFILGKITSSPFSQHIGCIVSNFDQQLKPGLVNTIVKEKTK